YAVQLKSKDPTTKITWSSQFKIDTSTSQLQMKSWSPVLRPNSTIKVLFGGSGPSPATTDFTFIQIDPPLIPINPDIRGPFTSPRNFVPYVDATAWPTPDLVSLASSSGQKWYMLAFVTSMKQTSGSVVPAWGGVTPIDSRLLVTQINTLRANGGDVGISFGGANGVELAQATTTSVQDLVTAYKSVIDMYSLRRIDFDIEGAAVEEKASVDRRNKAIAQLQKQYVTESKLRISYTLPVLPTGLTAGGVALLENALANGVRVDEVSLMTMDYGDSAWPPTSGSMAKAAQNAAKAVQLQLHNAGLPVTTVIRLIPMIGTNDVWTEIFSLNDARDLVTWCKQVEQQSCDYPITGLSFWSVGRDVRQTTTMKYASSTASGVVQDAHAFSRAFQVFSV
ncbi:hypothetical protein HDU93_001907, partial [Gonapodya sp. JEL0774]